MTSMQPYYSFTKVPKDQRKLLTIELPGAEPASLLDCYCTNPDCECVDVFMELLELTPIQNPDSGVGGKRLQKLASFFVSTQDWTIHHTEIVQKNRPIQLYLQDVKESLTEDIRLLLRTRFQEAKAYGRDHLPQLSELGYQPGQCVGFDEVYPEHEADKFQFEHMGTQYLVVDQYCIAPTCNCNEAVLTYVSLKPDSGVGNDRFVLRLSLVTGTYKVIQANGYSTSEMQQIHDAYLKHVGRNLGLFRQRYAKMKEYGRTQIPVVNKSVRRNVPIVKSAKISRNAPCPCGSGKKFKKCCGLSSAT